MDPAQLSNYRPISNLSFVSKLLERTVASQTSAYLSDNKLFPPLQSAYRPRHSTEAALLKIVNDALLAADRGMVTIINLLDYSAAFDTVDHSIAVDILQNKFGVTSSALQWFFNYLSGRSFSVSFNCQTHRHGLKLTSRFHSWGRSCTLPMRRNCRRSLKDMESFSTALQTTHSWVKRRLWRTFKQQSRHLSTVSRAYKTGAAHIVWSSMQPSRRWSGLSLVNN